MKRIVLLFGICPYVLFVMATIIWNGRHRFLDC